MTEEHVEITREAWARVWAKAVLEARPVSEGGKNDSTFRTMFEKDPLEAANYFRKHVDKDFPNPKKLIDDMKEYEGDSGKFFSEMDIPRLKEISEKGGEPVKYNELKKKTP